MSEVPTLINDLALILIVAGAVTLIFKKLKQPLVLGYIMAGFIVSPHMPYTMSVIDRTDIKTWADIREMFLLFSLGLDGHNARHHYAHHHLCYDDAGHRGGSWVRLEPHGLHLPWRYACNELHHYYL